MRLALTLAAAAVLSAGAIAQTAPSVDKITLDKSTFYTDPDGTTGPLEPQCDPRLAGQYLCDEIGSRITSAVG